MRRIDANAALSPRDAQQAAVMHGVQQVRRGVRRAAPIVSNRAVSEMLICLARVHRTTFAYELQQELRPLPAFGWPGRTAFGWDAGIRARMQQRLYRARHEAVSEKEVLLYAKPRVAAFEIAGPVALYAMAQYQALSARQRPDRVCLHKAQPVEGVFQRGGREEAAGDGEAPQGIEGNRHCQVLPEVQAPERIARRLRRAAIAWSYGFTPNAYTFDANVLTNTRPFETPSPLKCVNSGIVFPLL